MNRFEESTIELTVKRISEGLVASDYTEWATQGLLLGFDGINIKILAGLEAESSIFEAEEYFKKALKEIKITLPENDNSLILDYAKIIAQKVIDNKIEPEKGLKQLSKLYSVSDYSIVYLFDFSDLDEAIDMQIYGDQNYKYLCPELVKMDCKDVIIEECKLFLLFQKNNLPRDIYEMVYCNACGNRSKPILKKIELPWLPSNLYKFIFRKRQISEWHCSICNLTDLLYCSSIEGRKRYLKEIGIL